MSYTPPSGAEVAFSWEGAAPYTPPSGGAVDFSFAPRFPILVYPTGVQATTTLGSVLVWGRIDDSQASSWQNVTTGFVPAWIPINTVTAPSWVPVET